MFRNPHEILPLNDWPGICWGRGFEKNKLNFAVQKNVEFGGVLNKQVRLKRITTG